MATDGVGIVARGHWVSFWDRACAEGRRGACDVVTKIESQQCRQGSGWACNEAGIRLSTTGATVNGLTASEAFSRACFTGFAVACQNLSTGQPAGEPREFQHMPPRAVDYRVLLQEGNGPIRVANETQLYEMACRQEFADGCSRLGGIYLQAGDVAHAIPTLDRACELKAGSACMDLAALFGGSGRVLRDDTRSAAYFKKACALGVAGACR
jgi:TPR repeat protein